MATKKATTGTTKQKNINPPEDLSDSRFYGIRLDREQIDLANTIWNPNIDIIFVNSMAGTGKTLVATGVANMLVEYGLFKEIIYIMSPYAEKKQGWLPGTIEEKSSVYFDAFYQALDKCKVNVNTAVKSGGSIIDDGKTGYITCVTDTFLRGVNLDNAVVIIDEAQNFTIQQLKKVLTRINGKTKVIVIGHDGQCDLDDPSKSGFAPYMEHFKTMERAALCSLTINHRGWISRHADEI